MDALMRFNSSWKILALLAMALIIGVPGAHAETVSLRLTDSFSGDSVTIADGGAGDLSGAIDGVIIFIGNVGVWTMNMTTGEGSEVLGPGELSLSSLEITTLTEASTLTIEVYANGQYRHVSRLGAGIRRYPRRRDICRLYGLC